MHAAASFYTKKPCSILFRTNLEYVEIHAFRTGEWVTFGEYFWWKRTITSNTRQSGKPRDIPVSYGLRYRQTIISFCHNTRSWQRDRIATAIPCVAITCSRTVKMHTSLLPLNSTMCTTTYATCIVDEVNCWAEWQNDSIYGESRVNETCWQ